MKSRKGQFTIPSIFFLTAFILLYTALIPAITESLNIGFQAANNPLSKGLLAFMPAFILFQGISYAMASQEIELMERDRRKRRRMNRR